MAESSGFIDLRVGHGARGVGDDSVWPSFTDIMTVIVMIFLMALVVIMVRNFELDRQLISTISAKEAASLANEELVEKLIKLEYTLQDSQDRRSRLQASLEEELSRLATLSADQEVLKSELESVVAKRQLLEQENQQLQTDQDSAKKEIDKLAANEQLLNRKIEQISQQFSALEIKSDDQISSLTAEKTNLNDRLDTVSAQLQTVQDLLESAQLKNQGLIRDVAELEAENQDAEQRAVFANEEILALSKLIRQRESENAALEAQAASSSLQFQSLQEEFESLDEKYRKLVRAARSPAGKYVVDVWVIKVGSEFVFHLKRPEDPTRIQVSKAQLDTNLQALKNQHTESLYTRIVIPEDSQLSHNEAWEFTQEILQRYDYYYQ